jgi:ABC-2 type transport system permease protein
LFLKKLPENKKTKMRINTIKEITIKELKSQFDHLNGYILISLFLGLLYYFFLKTFFVNGVVSMRGLFQMLPWYMVIFVPAVTMGSFASEIEKQTFEYLETKPIKQMELVIGKILGATKIIFISILLTIPLPIFINRIAPLDVGEVVSGYLGALVLVFALSSLGVAVSTFYKNQIAAFITSAVIILTLIVINSDITAINIPTALANSLAQFSIVDNYDPIVRGVINLSNIVYFIIFVAASIAIAYTNVQKIRISRTTDLYKKTFAVTIIVAACGISLVYLSNYFGQQVGRIDLTSDKRYTLSKVTSETLAEEGKIIIEVFASDNLPPLYASAYEEIKNVLTDYRSAAKGNIEIRYLDPKVNGERISILDIQPVQFNTVGEDQLQIQQGYLALAIMNEDESKKEKIDYIQNVNDLEYQLTSIIGKIKSVSKPSVGFASGNGEKGLFTDYTYLQSILSSEYDLKSVFLKPVSDETENSPETTDTDLNLNQYNLLVIAGPDESYDEASISKINDYIKAGGNVLYMDDTLVIDPTTAAVSPIQNAGELLSPYGATINADMVYDLQNNLPVSVSETVRAPYPFFIYAGKDQHAEDVIQFLPNGVVIPWAASLNLDSNWKWLYSTSQAGGKQTGAIDIDPKATRPNQNLGYVPLVAMRETDTGGTLVIAGSSVIFEDRFAGYVQENAVLSLALFEKLAKGRGLSEIKAKNLMGFQFTFVDPEVKQMINYGAPVSTAVLLILIGASRIYRKKKLARIYSE